MDKFIYKVPASRITKKLELDKKWCYQCKSFKTRESTNFSKNKSKKDGLQDLCRPCKTTQMAAYKKSPLGIANTIRYAPIQRLKSKQSHIRRNYGLMPFDYMMLFLEQNYKCKICTKQILPYTQNAHVDHKHVTDYETLPLASKKKYVRGILCCACNTGLGLFRDNNESLASAKEYLANFESNGNRLA